VLAACLRDAATGTDALAGFVARRRPRRSWVRAQTHRRDRTGNLPPALRNLTLRILGRWIFRSNYRPLLESIQISQRSPPYGAGTAKAPALGRSVCNPARSNPLVLTAVSGVEHPRRRTPYDQGPQLPAATVKAGVTTRRPLGVRSPSVFRSGAGPGTTRMTLRHLKIRNPLITLQRRLLDYRSASVDAGEHRNRGQAADAARQVVSLHRSGSISRSSGRSRSGR
jgi:hypothetical protein